MKSVACSLMQTVQYVNLQAAAETLNQRSCWAVLHKLLPLDDKVLGFL